MQPIIGWGHGMVMSGDIAGSLLSIIIMYYLGIDCWLSHKASIHG